MKTTIAAAAAAMTLLSLAAPASATTVLLSFDGLACTNIDGGAANQSCAHNNFIGADYGSTTGLAVTYDASESTGSVTSLRSYDAGFYPNEGAYAPAPGSEFSFITFTPAAGYEVSFTSFNWSSGSATFVNYTFELLDPSANVLFHLEPNTTGSHVANTAYFSGPLTFGFTNGGSGGAVVDNLKLDLRQVTVVTPVPEPATWAMMILGFGAAGAVVRRRRAFA